MVHLLILGGSGRTGKHAVDYALRNGHQVTVLLRDPSVLAQHPNLTIVTGSCLSQSDVEKTFTSSSTPPEAAAIFLNANRTSDMPWSKPVAPPRFITNSVTNVCRAVQKQSSAKPSPSKFKLVFMSAIGVGSSIAITPWYLRLLIAHTNLSHTYADHNALDAEIHAGLAGPDTQWTAVRPVTLGNAGQKKVKVFGGDDRAAAPGMMITRESCAEWMVDVAAGRFGADYADRAVVVSN